MCRGIDCANGRAVALGLKPMRPEAVVNSWGGGGGVWGRCKPSGGVRGGALEIF